jgi:tRNA threonylcarbamoyladenosine biosynthesis protein TsaB
VESPAASYFISSDVNASNLTLAIDSSTTNTGLALAGDALLEMQRFAPPVRAGERLVPAISEVLERAQISVADLKLIVVAGGPGSFTGLRVGLSTVKGLAFGQAVPIVSISTLDVFAAQAPFSKGTVVPVVESRRSEVYAAFYKRDGGNLIPLSSAERLSYDALEKRLPDDALLIGPAAEALRTAYISLDRNIQFAPTPAHTLSLEWLIQLGRERFEKAGGDDLASLEPLYLQNFQPTPRKQRS